MYFSGIKFTVYIRDLFISPFSKTLKRFKNKWNEAIDQSQCWKTLNFEKFRFNEIRLTKCFFVESSLLHTHLESFIYFSPFQNLNELKHNWKINKTMLLWRINHNIEY